MDVAALGVDDHSGRHVAFSSIVPAPTETTERPSHWWNGPAQEQGLHVFPAQGRGRLGIRHGRCSYGVTTILPITSRSRIIRRPSAASSRGSTLSIVA